MLPDWCILGSMRLTINLDADVYTFASVYAGAKGISLSSAIGELVRRAEPVAGPAGDSRRLERNEHGYLEIADAGSPVTAEMVRHAAEEDLV